MTIRKSPATEAIALLIELAQKGEIDPWDVQVIEIIDRFLDELGLGNLSEINGQEADLPQSGQVILWASMLVLFKADTLEKLEEKEEEIEENPELELMEKLEHDSPYLPANLDKQIRRRTSALPPKKRRVTLTELIEQLQQIAAEIEITTTNKTSSLSKNHRQSRKETINAISQLAHNENLTELAGKLLDFFKQDLPLLAPQTASINLEQLLNWWGERNEQKSQDKVGVFWALLLLSSQSKVQLSQREFYQDLYITMI
jgi:segregation and condensation protein A